MSVCVCVCVNSTSNGEDEIYGNYSWSPAACCISHVPSEKLRGECVCGETLMEGYIISTVEEEAYRDHYFYSLMCFSGTACKCLTGR